MPPAYQSPFLLGLPVAGFKSALRCLLVPSFRSSSSSSSRQASAIGPGDNKGGLQAAASTIAMPRRADSRGSPLSAPAPDASRRRGRGVPVSTLPSSHPPPFAFSSLPSVSPSCNPGLFKGSGPNELRDVSLPRKTRDD